jgi:hypothetical protein
VQDHEQPNTQIIQLLCQVAVVSVHKGRIEQGRLICRAYGVDLSEEEMYDLAREWRKNWQIDEPRCRRSKCFLCGSKLSPNMEELCRCFRQAETGVFIEPRSLEEVNSVIDEYGPDWIVETIQCRDCNKLSSVTAGIIRSRFRSQLRHSDEVRYTSPKRCQTCYVERGKVNTGVRQVLSASVGDRVNGGRSRRSSDPNMPKVG